MKLTLATTLFLLFFPLSLLTAQGAPSSPMELTLDDCVRMGLAYSKGLDSSRWEIEHSRFQVKEVPASALPSLSLFPSRWRYAYADEKREKRSQQSP